MSKGFCSCKDWKSLKSIFKWHPPYGWIVSWIELSEEEGHSQVHRYGGKVCYCPLCGRKLKSNFEER
jgi:hypothetical protein